MATSGRFVSPSTIRPRLVLEVASEMVGSSTWPYRQARLILRNQGEDQDGFAMNLFGSASPDSIPEVAAGRLHIAMLNPASLLTMAYRGVGPFTEPLPLRAIAVIPAYDQLAFAFAQHVKVSALEELGEKKLPLRVSVRGSHDPAVRLLVDQVLSAVGFSLNDIEAWGGKVVYDQALANAPSRLGAVERGEMDAIFDEAIELWVDRAAGIGMRFLSLSDEHLWRLEERGFRRGTVEKQRHANLPDDVQTIDFSGYPIYTFADAPDHAIREFCAALHTRRDRIPWDAEGVSPLPLERMVRDSVDTPLETPLHPAAEAFWREVGYLS